MRYKCEQSKKDCFAGLFVSQALILSIVESWIPIPSPVPGVKLGLANIITVITIIFFGFREAVSVVIARCVLSSIFGGGDGCFSCSV